MSKKVKVSKEVADFIKLNNNGDIYWEDRLISEHSQAWINNFEGAYEVALCMKDISPFELAQILINDYEIELTPEERIADRYSIAQNAWIENADVWSKGFEEGVRFSLNNIGKLIKGVNC